MSVDKNNERDYSKAAIVASKLFYSGKGSHTTLKKTCFSPHLKESKLEVSKPVKGSTVRLAFRKVQVFSPEQAEIEAEEERTENEEFECGRKKKQKMV